MIAGVYATLTLVEGAPAFGPINLRFSNVLIGLVPIFGWPAVFGVALGVFLGNILGPNLGPLDIFLSPLFSLLGLVLIHYLRRRSVILGLASYSIILSLWVTYMLTLYIHLQFFPLFYYTLIGVSAMVLGLAYFLYKSLIAAGIKRRVQSVFPK